MKKIRMTAQQKKDFEHILFDKDLNTAAFCRFYDLPHPVISQILNGNKEMTEDYITKMFSSAEAMEDGEK